jgi:L-cystine uptake protein TcyP (sodium:dicarboxylate symporter family)
MLVLLEPAPIFIYKIQNSFRRCFTESTILPSAKYIIIIVTANVFTTSPTKNIISLQTFVLAFHYIMAVILHCKHAWLMERHLTST